MTAIRMATELLGRDAQGERARRLLGSINTSAERAQRMIVDLLDFASVRLGQGISIKRQRVDLLRVVDQCQRAEDHLQPRQHSSSFPRAGHVRSGSGQAAANDRQPGRQ